MFLRQSEQKQEALFSSVVTRVCQFPIKTTAGPYLSDWI